jgi:2-keto-4-pentenoate hydratase/2-oxohepta-3-ene-1,7-dioic acid hydratase in catechol pathway
LKLVTYRKSVDSAASLGVFSGDLIIDVHALGAAAGVAMPDTMLGLIDQGRPGLAALQSLLDDAGDVPPIGTSVDARNVKILAPIPRPRKGVFGIGLNYVEHLAEAAKINIVPKDLPTEPPLFIKPETCIIGPGEAIHHDSSITQQLDWEVELAAIIGTNARRVSKEDAMDHVFGYSVMIDVSARDNMRFKQWGFSKGMDTYGPFGPCIVTADDIPDPHKLDLWLSVNGVEKQRGNTKDMLFKIDHLIWDLSKYMTLEPGDIIATGTPAGVGVGREPQEFLKPGDRIDCGVENVGTLSHPVIDITPQI